MLYTVGEMATMLGLAPSTLRYYDKEGLLPFLQRSESGIRVFSDTDYEWLKIIECLKATGMPLKDIRGFIHLAMQGDDTIEQRLQLFLRQRESVLRQLTKLQETLDIIDFKCWYYEMARQAGTTAVVEQLTAEQIPPRFRAVRNRLQNLPADTADMKDSK